jgi:hypothetical protein
MEGTVEREVTSYKIPVELAEWVRDQARAERRYPAHLIRDAIKDYRRKIEKRNAKGSK